jgi:PAS domain S-box-containing protein
MDSLLKKLGGATSEPFTLAAINKSDQPLVYINQAFLDLTGYEETEILGKNCRFLQGQKTEQLAIKHIREAIAAELPICQDLLNYKKDGSTFWNRLILIPITIREQPYYFGFQNNISDNCGDLKVDARKSPIEISDKIRNLMSSVILCIDLYQKKPGLILQAKITANLKVVTSYLKSFK